MKIFEKLSNYTHDGAKLNLIFFQIKSLLDSLNLDIFIASKDEFIDINKKYASEKKYKWYIVPEYFMNNPRVVSLIIKERNTNIVYGTLILNPLDLPSWMTLYDAFAQYKEHYFTQTTIENIPPQLKFMSGNIVFSSGMWINPIFTRKVAQLNQFTPALQASWLLTSIAMLYSITYEHADYVTIIATNSNVKNKNKMSIIERYDLKDFAFGPVWHNILGHEQLQLNTIWIDKMNMANSVFNISKIIHSVDTPIPDIDLSLQSRLKKDA